MHAFIDLRNHNRIMKIFININGCNFKDNLEHPYGSALNEGMVEYYARKFCLNPQYNEEFKQKYGYEIPILPSERYQRPVVLARIFDNQLQFIDKKMVFNDNISSLEKNVGPTNPGLLKSVIECENDYYRVVVNNRTEIKKQQLNQPKIK